MNVVLHTNVLVAGLLSPFGPCGEIVRIVSSGELTLSFDARILSEYREVLQRPKFRFDQEKTAALLEYIIHCAQAVAPSPWTDGLPDPDDAAFLEAAIAGGAFCLITGNQGHFPARFRQGVLVLSPKEFLARYKKEKGRKRRGPKQPGPGKRGPAR